LLFFNAIQPISQAAGKPPAAVLDKSMQGVATTWLNAVGTE
jgi:hypothetical protein